MGKVCSLRSPSRTSKGAWPSSNNCSAVIAERLAAAAVDRRFAKAMNSRERPKVSRFFPLFPPGIVGHGEQTKSWRTDLYGGGKRLWRQWGINKLKGKIEKANVLRRRSSQGGKTNKAKVKRQKYCGSVRRRTS